MRRLALAPALALALTLLPVVAFCEELRVGTPIVPLAPPGSMAHAAYMELTNTGAATRQLIGIRAEGYAAAHLHRTSVQDGVATMAPVAMVELPPGQTVTFAHGGLHVMLMRPDAPRAEGDGVRLVLDFADGGTQTVVATVTRLRHGS